MYVPQLTADGSFTFFCAEFGEAFHSHHGARQEAQLKFVEPTQLRQKAQQHGSCFNGGDPTPVCSTEGTSLRVRSPLRRETRLQGCLTARNWLRNALPPVLRLLDVCYGLGYNTAAALATIWAVNPSCYVEVVGLEFNPAVPQAAIAHHLLNSWSQPIPQILTQLATEHRVQTNRLQASLLIGDARDTIRLVQSGFQADAIFLDPFSPPVCPQLWTVEFIEQVAKCLHLSGRLATYSCAAAVRTALMAAGLKVGSTPPVGRRSPGTVASWRATDLPVLSQQEQEHLLTRAAIPYRDPYLGDVRDVILHRRQQEQHTSSLEPTSHWRKRTRS